MLGVMPFIFPANGTLEFNVQVSPKELTGDRFGKRLLTLVEGEKMSPYS